MNILQTKMPNVVLLNGTTDIDIDYDGVYSDTEALTVQAPTYAEVLSWQGSVDGVTFVPIQDLTGTALKFPAQNTIIIYNGVFSGLKTLRIHAAGPAAADRTFMIQKAWRGI
jgi:hypothetical protein